MKRSNNLHQLRQDVTQVIGTLEQTPENIDGVRKISQQLGSSHDEPIGRLLLDKTIKIHKADIRFAFPE